MGYCTYGGKMVPGNNQASCIGGGGNWVGGETGADSQLGMPPMAGFQAFETNRPPIRPEPDKGIQGYKAPQYTISPADITTDDFGNRLDTNAYGDANFGTLRDRAVNKNNTSIFDAPSQGPLARNTTADPRTTQTYNGVRPMTSQEMGAQDSYNAGQKIKGIFGADDQSKAAAMQSKTPLNTGIPTSPNPYDGQNGPVKDKVVVDQDEIILERQAPHPGIQPIKKDVIPAVPPVQPTTKTKGAPANTNTIVEGQQGLLQNIQSKDWWMKPTEGGSGAWDNRLFRLGEMMTHMGTPLSKQGDSPTKRWTSAAASAATLKAAKAKANKPKSTTPLAISAGGVRPYIDSELSDKYTSFAWFDELSQAERDGYAGVMAETVRKEVRRIELANPGKRVNIQAVSDKVIANLEEQLNKNKK